MLEASLMSQDRSHDTEDVFRRLVMGMELVLHAAASIDQHLSQEAMALLKKMNVNGSVVVINFDSDELPSCGLACSIGIGGFGIVFMNKAILGNPNIPEEAKSFILAHEVAHIARSHLLPRITFRFVAGLIAKILDEIARSQEEAESFSAPFFLRLISTLLLSIALGAIGEADRQIVRQEELEADDIAITLAGCGGAIWFAKVLEWLRSQGVEVSHESILGFPALTIDERVKMIYQRCQRG